MMLIADSGSTKTEWQCVLTDGTSVELRSEGLNPVFTDGEKAKTILLNVKAGLPQQSVGHIFFYGAGCRQEEYKKLVRSWIMDVFPGASVEVESDLLGAARALCEEKPGIAVILGTGSNSCVCDGRAIVRQQVSLGYVLGDEGSGSSLGKKMLRDYFYGRMPAHLMRALEHEMKVELETVIRSVYREPQPNRFLASFAPFISRHREEDYCRELLLEAFGEFAQAHLLSYPEIAELPVHFTGSVAAFFEEFIQMTAEKYGFRMGTIRQHPVEGLVRYHQRYR